MNWSCGCGCIRGRANGDVGDSRRDSNSNLRSQNARNIRHCWCPWGCLKLADRAPTVRSLAFLPDAYATALYARYHALIFIDDKPGLPEAIVSLAPEAGAAAKRGITRLVGPAVDPGAVAAAEADISAAVNTERFFLRLWRLRWAILHVWAIQVSSYQVPQEF